ncbi:unnamed protein product [Ixodes pacificus]
MQTDIAGWCLELKKKKSNCNIAGCCTIFSITTGDEKCSCGRHFMIGQMLTMMPLTGLILLSPMDIIVMSDCQL